MTLLAVTVILRLEGADLISTALAYLGPIVFDNTVGSIGFFEMVEHALFASVVTLGVIMWRDSDAY